MKFSARLLNDFEIVKTLSFNELKLKYKRNMLGFAWSMLNPILSIGIIAIVFSSLMDMIFFDFLLFLFPAFLSWNFFANSVNSSALSLIVNEHFIKKVAINKFIFPAVVTTVNLIDFILSLSSLFVIAVLLGFKLNLALLSLPIALGLLMMFTLGLALIVSVANAYWRDLSHLVSVFMQFWFYLTPIIYPKARLTKIPFLLQINPMVIYVDMFRLPIYEAKVLPLEFYGAALLISSAVLATGYFTFLKYQNNIVYRL